MARTTTTLVLMLLICLSGFAQIKTIRATSTSVNIRDGNKLRKNAWTISPKTKPDTYETASLGKRVTFYTDIDSISIRITATTKYDFIILLNGTVEAPTQIKYNPQKERNYEEVFLERLRKGAIFNVTDNRTVPKFEYQDKSNPNLVLLRREFKLDSIAGQGDERLKVLNLMHWIHNLIPHDGQHENPVVKNAMSLIRQCKTESRGLNCRGLATVLNECYLAMGIKSRFVTCLPKDSLDPDCHVINTVFLKAKKKWIWIDPTNNAYVMDEKGELLSIPEVRERLIANKPLLLNPDANWNNKIAQTKEDYLYNYMTKNLYRFECPLISEYDTETKAEGKQITYVELLPMDAASQKSDMNNVRNAKSGVTFVTYKTNNPTLFWQLP